MPRELITPRGDKRYMRRGKSGKFKESDDVGRSLSADRRKKAKTVVRKGEGDRGDQGLANGCFPPPNPSAITGRGTEMAHNNTSQRSQCESSARSRPKAAAVVAEDLRARRRRLHRVRQAADPAPAVVAVPAGNRSSASLGGTATETEAWPPVPRSRELDIQTR